MLCTVSSYITIYSSEPDSEFDSYMQGPSVVANTSGVVLGNSGYTTTTCNSSGNWASLKLCKFIFNFYHNNYLILSFVDITKTVSIVGPISSVSSVSTVVPVSSVGPVIVIAEDSSAWTSPKPLPGPNMPVQDVIKSLVDFLASRYMSLIMFL